ncbi:uncharacterized protein LOC130994398 [Salvia miltiorrhiza]|uniref:uncharacterized protein LOC130994398 n=1 Tax=Salvia miltiorrhiza TaxID=226208 RepID=UPI0025AD17DF|nr:uncharacterized protein LOC130994398 [Salvia miltiorrhiza]
MSYNIRGLGSVAKKRDVLDNIRMQRVDFCFLQETKLEVFEEHVCSGWWGRHNFDVAVRNAEGRAGGILSAWNTASFTASSKWDIPGAVVVNGFRQDDGRAFCLVNVYAPCDSSGKSELWDKLKLVADQNSERCVCFLGDFNAIRDESERVGRGEQFGRADMRRFDSFLRDCGLTEVRTQGRRFTWYQASGGCKTKLDRFFVNDTWLEAWPETVGRCLKRSVSDHCPILLSTKKVEWGPKPFRFVNAWTTHPEFKGLVRRVWEETTVEGWGCFVLKEKLKALRTALKEWNRTSFGHFDDEIKKGKAELQQWDEVDETAGLDEQGVLKRNEAMARIALHTRNKNAFLAQKSKTRWLREAMPTQASTINSSLVREREMK